METKEQRETVIFHGGCMDGLFAAYLYDLSCHDSTSESKLTLTCGDKPVIRTYVPTFHKTATNIDIPNEGIVTYIDICPSINEAKQLIANPAIIRINIIDHHLTSKPTIDFLSDYIKSSELQSRVFVIYNYENTECATMLIHKWLPKHLQSEKIAQIATVIDDRDRWVWTDPRSRAIGTYMFQEMKMPGNHKYTLETFELITKMFVGKGSMPIDDMYEHGNIYEKYAAKIVTQLCSPWLSKFGTLTTPSGRTYKVVHTPTRFMASEVANTMLIRYAAHVDLAMCWYYDTDKDEFWLSFRSDDKHADTSVISKEFGGGGHRNASGCTMRGPFSSVITPLAIDIPKQENDNVNISVNT